MDRFTELRAFAAVVDAGGFSAAGRALGQSRSSINRLVLALEARLGAQLLHRTTRSVAPNSDGRAVYERARRLLDDMDELERAVASRRTEPVGRLRVSAPPAFGDLDFAALVAAYMARHPKVEVDITFEARFADPTAEGQDVVIRIGALDEETTMVDHRVLRLDYLLCASPAYLAAWGAPRRPAELKTHAALFHSGGDRGRAWTLIGPEGPSTVALRPVLTSNDMETLRAAAMAGLGVTMMPEYAVRSDLQAGRLARVLPDHALETRMLQVIYPPTRHLSAVVRSFTDFVADWCGPADAARP